MIKVGISQMWSSLLQDAYGDEESRKDVQKMMPQKVKKRRKIQTEEGVSIFQLSFGWGGVGGGGGWKEVGYAVNCELLNSFTTYLLPGLFSPQALPVQSLMTVADETILTFSNLFTSLWKLDRSVMLAFTGKSNMKTKQTK